MCLYWARLSATSRVTKREIIDFFWSNGQNLVDPGNAEVRGRTAIHYLHGAIHLWQDDLGANGKWTNADGGKLLSVAANYAPGSCRRPLFVSEGTSRAKLRTIRQSPLPVVVLRELAGGGPRGQGRLRALTR